MIQILRFMWVAWVIAAFWLYNHDAPHEAVVMIIAAPVLAVINQFVFAHFHKEH